MSGMELTGIACSGTARMGPTQWQHAKLLCDSEWRNLLLGIHKLYPDL